MSKLLKEAIADAKAVRETALANARLALEEAFAPRLQSMLTKKLREEELEGAESEETSDEVEEGSYYEDDEEVEDVVADEEPAVEAPAEEEPAEEAPVEEPVADEAPSDEEEVAEDDLEAEFSADEDESGEEDAFDLDSVIKELEDELASEPYEEEPVEEQSDSSELGTGGEEHVNVADSDDEDLPDDTEVQSAQVGEEDDELEKVADIDEDIDIEIVDEEAPAGDESDEPTATESDEELAFPTNEEDCNQGGDIGEDDEEINLEEILKELEDETLEDEEEGSPEIEELKVSNTKLQKENEEYRKVYKYLRGKLNEVNLLNAKLLYTNKLFKAHVLNEDQKLKVVESFDLTKNVREAKLVYATLGESFRSSTTRETAPVAKPKAHSTKKSLTEGMASKPIKSTKPSKKILSEGNDLANRFKKLAGIV
jgi:hypothetical protein